TPTHKIDKVGNTKIMHVDFNSIERKFKAPTIFNSNQNQEFINSQLFILFRDPVERIISIGIFLHVSTTILFESSKDHKFNLAKLSTIIAAIVIAYFI
ncbi:hypothetical protein N9863_02210, partial [Flavobacteriaceae bacterium]|nr:hypothetical protein [Flavobacteriaceae bacterium]